MVTTSRGVSRLVYIDSLRGIASLAVAVFFHYRHFSSLFQPGGAPPRSAPFYTLLRPLYNYGYLAVDVFFISPASSSVTSMANRSGRAG